MRIDVLKERITTLTDTESSLELVKQLTDYSDAGAMEMAWILARLTTKRGEGTIEAIARHTRKSPETIRLLMRVGRVFSPDVVLHDATSTMYALLNISHLTTVLPTYNREGWEVAADWVQRAAYGDAQSVQDGVDSPWPIQYFKKRLAQSDKEDEPLKVLKLDALEVLSSHRPEYVGLVFPRAELEACGFELGMLVNVTIKLARIETQG